MRWKFWRKKKNEEKIEQIEVKPKFEEIQPLKNETIISAKDHKGFTIVNKKGVHE